MTKVGPHFIRLLSINFRSVRNKVGPLQTLILTFDPDVILGTETWLTGSICNSQILPRHLGYELYRRDRQTGNRGGVLMAAKSHLMMRNVQKSSEIELIWGSISDGNKSMTIASYYRPPRVYDRRYLAITMKEFAAIRNNSDVTLVGGDFNLPDINWVNYSITGSQYPREVNIRFLEMLVDNCLDQVVDFPTRKDKTLDIVLASHPRYVRRCRPLSPLGNSDHDIVLLDTLV